MVDEFGHDEHQLNIRERILLPGLDIAGSLREIGCQHPSTESAPLNHAFKDCPRTRQRQPEQASGRAGFIAVNDIDVVLQVLAYTWRIMDHRNAVMFEVRSRS